MRLLLRVLELWSGGSDSIWSEQKPKDGVDREQGISPNHRLHACIYLGKTAKCHDYLRYIRNSLKYPFIFKIVSMLYMTGFKVPSPSFCKVNPATITQGSNTLKTWALVVKIPHIKLFQKIIGLVQIVWSKLTFFLTFRWKNGKNGQNSLWKFSLTPLNIPQ